MSVKTNDLQAQYETIREEIDQAIARTLAHCGFILGREAKSFEEAFADFCGTKHAVAVSNGTEAIRMVLLALGVSPGDEVITVSHTFVATVEAVVTVGATPVMIDVDPDTMTMDPKAVEAARTDRTKVILPVHLYGQCADVDAIKQAADDIPIIEDAAQAQGACCRGRRAGSLGIAGTFSFFPGKNLGAYGDAGGVTTDDDILADTVRSLRDHGRTSKFEHNQIGYNARMDGMQAAILGVKLRHLDNWNQRRRDIAAMYDEAFQGCTGVQAVRTLDHNEPVFHQYVIQVEDRDGLRSFLEERQIASGIHYPIPVHLQSGYTEWRGKHKLEVTEHIVDRILSLPIYPEMPDEQVIEVANAVRRFVEC